ncbi:hypothetical protein BKE38_14945 [Pseudoroseomonas deserti]|uniref:Uncharacterized protein n=1 Tax=Teichococcus deserti TaxID=1817963 RepID=A0A1V2H1B0_9PROT|nr:hypothetical protein [Pseudoroseomonas deserti]ONG52217.1 hypothetical protein BKE38_14945 [Pseudoroseomonas deserti]
MSLPIAIERRLLTGQEFELVARSHYPALCSLERPALVELARRLRDYRGKARDVARERRRAQRGKAEPRGTNPEVAPEGLTRKKQVFASALKRVNKELSRQEATPETQGENARRALAMKRAARLHRHPASRRTARHGMNPVESQAVAGTIDPRQVGSVSQQGRDFQGKKDS